MENTIIEARFSKNKLFQILLTIGIVLFSISAIYCLYEYNTAGYSYDGYYLHNMFRYYRELGFSDYLARFLSFETRGFFTVIMFYTSIILLLAAAYFYWMLKNSNLTVTNRKVVGKAKFNYLIDLPLSQISAIGTGFWGKLIISTDSGKICFWFVENISEVYSVLTELIGKVQIESIYSKPENAPATTSADELKKYKELLDTGVITQEEFDNKKKQLLGL